MQKILGTIVMLVALTLVAACNSSDGGISVVEFEGGETATGGSTGGASGGASGGAAGSQTYSVSLLGLEVQQKGGTTSVPVGGLPVDGATVTGP